MKSYNVEQGSMEWHDLRLGRPTASEFKKIITPSKGDLSKSCRNYIAQLIQETRVPFYPEHAEAFTNRSMRWGKEIEAEARNWYAYETGLDVVQIGFITTDDGRFGCSPDGIIMDSGKAVGGLELKCTDPGRFPGDSNVHTEWLLDGILPLEHKCQVHASLAISDLEWWDFVSFRPPIKDAENFLPSLKIRVYPDDFTKAVKAAMEPFWEQYQAALKRIKEL